MGDAESVPILPKDYSSEEQLPQYYSEAEASFSRYQIDPDEKLEELMHKLRGERRNPLTQEWELPEHGKRVMNEMGVQDTITDLGFVVNKDTVLSVLTEDQINRMCLTRGLYLVDKLSAHMEEYEIDPVDFPMIVLNLTDFIESYLCRAKDGKTLYGFQRIYKFLEKSGGGEGKKQDSFNLGIFGKGNKGGK